MNQQSVMNHRGFRCKKNLLPCGIVRIHAEIEGRQILLHSKHHLQRIASHVPIFRKTASCSSMFLWYSMRFPFTCPFTQNFPPTNAHFTPAPSLWARQGRRCEFLQFLGFQRGDRLRVLEPWFFFPRRAAKDTNLGLLGVDIPREIHRAPGFQDLKLSASILSYLGKGYPMFQYVCQHVWSACSSMWQNATRQLEDCVTNGHQSTQWPPSFPRALASRSTTEPSTMQYLSWTSLSSRDFYIMINVHVNNPIHLILNTPFIPILWSQTCLIKFHEMPLQNVTNTWFLEGCFIWGWDYIHDIHQKSWPGYKPIYPSDLWHLGIFLGTTFCALGERPAGTAGLGNHGGSVSCAENICV